MTTKLTKEQSDKLSRGYSWNPDMSFETFCDVNNFPTYSDDARQLFNEIDRDYCVFIYEKEFK